jgi:predicted phage terminase large subunit-like protein
MGLHWLDCAELRIEPKDLKDSFLDFWQDCMRHSVPPLLAAIEKKSTGVTLVSVLKELRGIQVRDIERTRISGSKTQRFLSTQPHIAARKISFTTGARHVDMCITHMTKITANDTHRHDDIADTCADAVKIALIDKLINPATKQNDQLAAKLMSKQNAVNRVKDRVYGRF